MKKVFFVILAVLLAVMIFFLFEINKDILSKKSQEKENEITNEQIQEEIPVDKRSVTYNGWLHTKGTKLVNEHDEIVQLRGMSSHGIEWYGNIVTKENLAELKELWNTNIFRIAMYTDTNDGNGYCFHQEYDKQLAYQMIDMCIDLDMYVIVDWHILTDNNPQIHQDSAMTFFNEVSQKYAEVPNVLYEICNEPNGATDWDNNIKPYAEAVIPVIRKNSPKSVILVGTPNWSQLVNKAADNPLSFENICYTLHFYSGTHKQELRDVAQYAINKGVPVFVSECGMTTADGNGELYEEEFKTWVSFMDKNDISYCYWSLSNKNEGSAALIPSYTPTIKVESENTNTNQVSNNVVTNTTANTTNTTTNNTVQNTTSNDDYAKKLQGMLNPKTNTTNTTNTTVSITNDINDGLTIEGTENTKELPQSMENFLSASGRAIKTIFNSYIN